MATNTITLELPEGLYEKLRQMAVATNRSPEQILRQMIYVRW